MMITKTIIFAIVVMAIRADDCSDSLPERVCTKLSEDGKCQYGFAKDKCASTCDACDWEDPNGKPSTETPAEPTTESGGDEVEEPTEKPEEPTECNAANMGRCECGEPADGFTTYTFWIGDVQRCFTVYRPTSRETEKLPVMLAMRCYGEDKLMGLNMGRETLPENVAATQYGYSRFGLSTPDGHWTFGNDGVVNDANPQPCSAEESKDIPYLQAIFDFIEANPDKFDSDKIYAEGFSQNSMFAAYTSFCFPEKVVGLWQGGSGMALTGVPPNLPAMQAQCTMTSFNEHAKDCADKDPCTDCQYWPIYPCYSSSRPMVDCIADYTNDWIAVDRQTLDSSAEYMYEAQIREGHDARLLRFDPSEDETIAGGHKDPKNTAYWQVGCLGITEPCSEACEASFIACVNSGDVSSAEGRVDTWADCISEPNFSSNLGGCTAACAPTYNMLIESETPVIAKFDNFGAGTGVAGEAPADSLCQV